MVKVALPGLMHLALRWPNAFANKLTAAKSSLEILMNSFKGKQLNKIFEGVVLNWNIAGIH